MTLEIRGVTKNYGKHKALEDVSLVLKNGIYGLLGPNGAGKSTLMDVIATVLPATCGEVMLDAVPILSMGADYRALLGYLPQNPPFYKGFRAQEFLNYMAVLKGVKQRETDRQSETALRNVGLWDVRKKRIREFSGGMRQRLGIAQALLGNPRILLLDEPTVGLDPAERIHFSNMLGRLSGDHIILLSTHIVSDIESIAENLIVIGFGKCIYTGNTGDFANCACGNVYELRVSQNEPPRLPAGAMTAAIRVTDGIRTLRVISKEPPQNARAVNASIQDAYLSIFGEGAEL